MEPTLLVIGLNHHTAPLAMRERFWIGEQRLSGVLQWLRSAEGIEEVVVLSTCCRTEFQMWASEPTLAANSLVHFLGTEYGLKLCEWEHFYRLLGEEAIAHVFRVVAGLDSPPPREPHLTPQMVAALEKARGTGAAGRFLSAVWSKAREVAARVPREAIQPAEKILAAEAHALNETLRAEKVVPAIVGLRQRLDELCRQELDSFVEERGPFTREQDQFIHEITGQIMQKIANSLARELKEFPESGEQERMTAAVTRLFHLNAPELALAGTKLKENLGRKTHDRHKGIAVH
ncbi:MAG TPA: hypothetical protein VMH04_16105 [Candidatus Solibacter sp.]|nr:hypothetical protein [Candidatus Solibacter sp.]